MSQKPNLVYDSKTPAFLQRLRGQMPAGLAGEDGPRARRGTAGKVPARLAMEEDGEEDGPAYVIEGTGESVSRAEYEALVREAEAAGADEAPGDEEGEGAEKGLPVGVVERKSAGAVEAAIGGGRVKRKGGRVVGGRDGGSGGGEDDGAPAGTGPGKSRVKQTRPARDGSGGSGGEEGEEGGERQGRREDEDRPAKRAKKGAEKGGKGKGKKKKLVLSFSREEEA